MDQQQIFLIVGLVMIGYSLRKWFKSARHDIGSLIWAQANPSFKVTTEDRMMNLRFPRFDCLQRGSDQYAENIAEGDWNGHHLIAFDYHYWENKDTKDDSPPVLRHISAVILTSPVTLEPLFLRPEGFLDKVKEFVGIRDKDIDFESAEFSRRFFVTADDKKWAYDVLHQRTIEFLLSKPDFSIQFDWNCAIAWRESTFSAEEFQLAAEVLKGIFDRLPEYLTQQQRTNYDMAEKEISNAGNA